MTREEIIEELKYLIGKLEYADYETSDRKEGVTMAQAMKCDRCGKFYEYYEGSKTFKNTEKANTIFLIDMDLNKKYRSCKTYDLCPDCMKKFEDFLKGKSHE